MPRLESEPGKYRSEIRNGVLVYIPLTFPAGFVLAREGYSIDWQPLFDQVRQETEQRQRPKPDPQ